MNWEEHIDLLKKAFPPEEFSVPFNTWVDILKKIENRFIVKVNSNYHFSNWGDHIKRKIQVAIFGSNDLKKVLLVLPDSTNYWVIMPVGRGADAKNYVYDCNLQSLIAITRVAKGSFFIVEKHYVWFTYFCFCGEKENYMLFKSTEAITPFDEI
jgi:hypothetical protein